MSTRDQATFGACLAALGSSVKQGRPWEALCLGVYTARVRELQSRWGGERRKVPTFREFSGLREEASPSSLGILV